MSLSEIKRMALETASKGLTHEYEMEMAFESSSVPHAYYGYICQKYLLLTTYIT